MKISFLGVCYVQLFIKKGIKSEINIFQIGRMFCERGL